MVFFADDRVLV